MDQMWFLVNKINWEGQVFFVGEEVILYFIKIVFYDVYVVLGVFGIEVEEVVDVIKSEFCKNEVEKENGKVDVYYWILFFDQSFVNFEGLLVVLLVLMKGLFFVVQ